MYAEVHLRFVFNSLGRDLFYKMHLNSPFMVDDMYMNPFSTTFRVFCVWRFGGWVMEGVTTADIVNKNNSNKSKHI